MPRGRGASLTIRSPGFPAVPQGERSRPLLQCCVLAQFTRGHHRICSGCDRTLPCAVTSPQLVKLNACASEVHAVGSITRYNKSNIPVMCPPSLGYPCASIGVALLHPYTLLGPCSFYRHSENSSQLTRRTRIKYPSLIHL